MVKQWLLKHYGNSTFNTYPHKQLQEMSGPPIEMYLDEMQQLACVPTNTIALAEEGREKRFTDTL